MQTTYAPCARACFTSVITLIVEYAALMPHSTTSSLPTIWFESLPVTAPSVARQPAYAVSTQIVRSSRLAPSAWKSGWPAKYCTCPIVPAYENGRIAGAPLSAMMARQRATMVASASSQEIGVNSPAPSEDGGPATPDPHTPFGPTRLRGRSTRSGECTRSAYARTLPQITPCVNGWSGFPVTSTIRPCSVSTTSAHADGQSCGQTDNIATTN